MISGEVQASREAIVRLGIRATPRPPEDLPAGQEEAVHFMNAIIDTGFTGFLTLPPSLIQDMGLSFAGYQEAILGDGSSQVLEVYKGLVEWDGAEYIAEIDAADTDPLLGMSLLYGYKLTVEVIDGGKVTIERL